VGFGTGAAGLGTGEIGFGTGAGAPGLGTGEVGFRACAAGLEKGAVGFETGAPGLRIGVGFRTGAAGLGKGAVGFETGAPGLGIAEVSFGTGAAKVGADGLKGADAPPTCPSTRPINKTNINKAAKRIGLHEFLTGVLLISMNILDCAGMVGWVGGSNNKNERDAMIN
jgi:hypothetical protein